MPLGIGDSLRCDNASALRDQCVNAADPTKCVFQDCCRSCDRFGVDACAQGTTLERLPVKEHYWRATELDERLYRCFYAESCIGTQAGREDFGDGLCRRGHKGPLCTECKRNHYFSAAERGCEPCGPGSALVLPGLVVIIGLALAAGLFWVLKPGVVSRIESLLDPEELAARVLGETARDRTREILTKIKRAPVSIVASGSKPLTRRRDLLVHVHTGSLSPATRSFQRS